MASATWNSVSSPGSLRPSGSAGRPSGEAPPTPRGFRCSSRQPAHLEIEAAEDFELGARPPGPSPVEAHVSGHGCKGLAGTVILFPVGGPAGSDACNESGRLGGRILPGQRLDDSCRDPGDPFGPGRRFRHAILDSENIVPEGLEPESVLIQKGLILKVLSDDQMSHRDQHGRVRAGDDRNPLICKEGGRVGVPGVDGNDLRPFFFCLHEVPARIRLMNGIGRVPPPHDDQA